MSYVDPGVAWSKVADALDNVAKALTYHARVQERRFDWEIERARKWEEQERMREANRKVEEEIRKADAELVAQG